MIGAYEKGYNNRINVLGFGSDKDLADEPNHFYSWFDVHDFTDKVRVSRNITRAPSAVSIDMKSVEMLFSHIK